MIITIVAFLGALWLVLIAAFVGIVLAHKAERVREPRYLRDAREAAGKR